MLCAAWAVDDQAIEYSCGASFTAKKLLDYRAAGAEFVAHNAAFEYAICKNVLKVDIPIDRWRCTAALAAYYSLPRALGDAAKALDLSKKKDEEGKKIMLKMSKPVPERYQHLHGKWYSCPQDYVKLISYCEDDVETERALENALPPLPDDEQKLWELDQKINNRGLTVDTDLCTAAIQLRDDNYNRLIAECKEITGGILPSQTKKLSEWLGIKSVAKDLLPDLIEQEQDDNKKRVLEIRQEFATSSLAKFDAAMNWQVDGKVRGSLLYHGAKTGRWTGKGVQFQNVPQGAIRTEDSNQLLAHMIKEAASE
jgi:DNA polymerase